MNKKILINASILTGNKNGVEIYTIEVLKRIIPLLISNGFLVEIYTYEPGLLLDYGIKSKKILMSKSFLMFSNNRSLHRIFWNFFILPQIAKSFHIVYSPCTYGGCKIKNQIVTVHDLISLKFPFNHLFQFFYFKTIVPSILKNSTIISISDFTKESIKFHYNIKEETINTIYNGSDHLNVSSKTDLAIDGEVKLRSNSYFLIVGLTYHHKNGLRVLEAIEKLGSINYNFVIVGRKTKYFQKIRKIASDKKLKNVIFLDDVNDEMLSRLYANCLANIYLSLFEGFGFPPLEAAYYGKISIISDSTALSEVYKNHAIFVNPYDVDLIKDRISKFIIDFEKSNLIDLNLDVLISKYKWSESADKIFELINNKSV